MADNFTTSDASAVTVTLAASDDGSAKAAKIVSFTVEPSATVIRPNDANAYTAADAITSATSSATAYTFSNCARLNGGCGTIPAIDVTHNCDAAKGMLSRTSALSGPATTPLSNPFSHGL